ncbi:MAG: 16S rRNA (guanine(966)-N(2))-methyltransferase RsmD [Bacteroidota bacterium]
MRITGGSFVRQPIQAPKGARTRPTTDRVREALFSILASRMALPGAHVLDAFAGSGALGLEALSRGAAHCTFVESHGPTLALTRRNAATLGVASRSAFVRADALKSLTAGDASFDLILADPPYALRQLAEIPALARARLTPAGLAVVEHDARHEFGDAAGHVLSRAYGSTVVSLFEP